MISHFLLWDDDKPDIIMKPTSTYFCLKALDVLVLLADDFVHFKHLFLEGSLKIVKYV